MPRQTISQIAQAFLISYGRYIGARKAIGINNRVSQNLSQELSESFKKSLEGAAVLAKWGHANHFDTNPITDMLDRGGGYIDGTGFHLDNDRFNEMSICLQRLRRLAGDDFINSTENSISIMFVASDELSAKAIAAHLRKIKYPLGGDALIRGALGKDKNSAHGKLLAAMVNADRLVSKMHYKGKRGYGLPGWKQSH